MIDLNSTTRFQHRVNHFVHGSLFEDRKAEKPRKYLGASVIGKDCERMIQFKILRTPKTNDEMSGRALTIFRVGHVLEDVMAEMFNRSGYTLHVLVDGTNKQHGWSALDDRFKGHVDGIFSAVPGKFGMFSVPAIWECKTLNNRNFRMIQRKGLKGFDIPWMGGRTYFKQVQLNMFCMRLHNPTVFTAMNKDTQELYHELIPFDPAMGRNLFDKAKRILQYCDAGEWLPRVAKASTSEKCKYCDWKTQCWSM